MRVRMLLLRLQQILTIISIDPVVYAYASFPPSKLSVQL